ncbi:MAG: hypothetical protein ABW223_08480 [Rariglobus sp.]
MKSAAATLRRLLQALEDSGFREDGALSAGDGLTFLTLAQRAEPLVTRIAELTAAEPASIDLSLRERGRALVEARRERRQRLTRLLETTRDEISRLDEARARARALRPTYASKPSAPFSAPAFNACG